MAAWTQGVTTSVQRQNDFPGLQLGDPLCVVLAGRRSLVGLFLSRLMDEVKGQDLRTAIRQCRHYICHAVIGSIVTVLAEGVMPLAIPRCHELGEHVVGQLLQITEKLVDLGMVRVFHSLT